MFLLPLSSFSQFERYLIDVGKLHKSEKIDVKTKVQEYKVTKVLREESREYYKQQRITEKERKKYRRTVQTKKVQKRMRKSEQIARKNNKNKLPQPFYISIGWEIKKCYGRLH